MSNECVGMWRSIRTQYRDRNGPVTPVESEETIRIFDTSPLTGDWRDEFNTIDLENISCRFSGEFLTLSFQRGHPDGTRFHYSGNIVDDALGGAYFVTGILEAEGDSGTWEAQREPIQEDQGKEQRKR